MSVRLLWADGGELRAGPDARAAGEPFSALLRTARALQQRPRAPRRRRLAARRAIRARARCWSRPRSSGEDVEPAQAERDAARRGCSTSTRGCKRMTTLDDEPGRPRWSARQGRAARAARALHADARGRDGDRPLDDADRARDRARRSSATPPQGLRVLGFAERRVAGDAGERPRRRAESGLDLPRAGRARGPAARRSRRRRRALPRARASAIIVITGDHGLTAAAIAREVGHRRRRPGVVDRRRDRRACPSRSSTRCCATHRRAHRRAQQPGDEAAHRRRAARRRATRSR